MQRLSPLVSSKHNTINIQVILSNIIFGNIKFIIEILINYDKIDTKI
jgi:hypothetical protein